jgi:hypothetical protein
MHPIFSLMMTAALIAAVAAPVSGEPVPGKPKLSDLGWMQGAWHGEGLGGQIEEHWTAPSGGTMVGAFRLVSDGKSGVIEYLMITEEPERIVYRFKHFRPDYGTWEKEQPLEFTLISATPDEAIFHSEVPDQHSPRRLTYRLSGGDSLLVVVEGSDAGGQITEGFEARFTRR